MRASSKESKESFLEKKGVTSAEIDEAFCRLPANMTGRKDSPNLDCAYIAPDEHLFVGVKFPKS